MSNDGDGRRDLAGMPIEDAIALVDRHGGADRETTRAALELVATDDGLLSRDAAEDALAKTARIVSTPETRTELAARSLE